jgi:hypothetical protein
MHPIRECLRLIQINRGGPASISCAEGVRYSSPARQRGAPPSFHAVHGRRWVKPGKPRSEQMFSALPQKADVARATGVRRPVASRIGSRCPIRRDRLVARSGLAPAVAGHCGDDRAIGNHVVGAIEFCLLRSRHRTRRWGRWQRAARSCADVRKDRPRLWLPLLTSGRCRPAVCLSALQVPPRPSSAARPCGAPTEC